MISISTRSLRRRGGEGGPPIEGGVIEIKLPEDLVEKSRLTTLARIRVYPDLSPVDIILSKPNPKVQIVENPTFVTVEKTADSFRIYITNEISGSIDLGFKIDLPLFAF